MTGFADQLLTELRNPVGAAVVVLTWDGLRVYLGTQNKKIDYDLTIALIKYVEDRGLRLDKPEPPGFQ